MLENTNTNTHICFIIFYSHKLQLYFLHITKIQNNSSTHTTDIYNLQNRPSKIHKLI
jgi:hypothetical protein